MVIISIWKYCEINLEGVIMLREMFSDKDGNLSTKRIIGTLSIITGIVLTVLEVGDPDLVKAIIYSGFVALGVTAFEKKL